MKNESGDIIKDQYIYAVAKIRAKETTLLTEQDINMLMSFKEYTDCLKFIKSKGFGENNQNDIEEIFSTETNKIWHDVFEMINDKSKFEILLLPIDFNNLKVCIKSIITGCDPEKLFINFGNLSLKKTLDAIKARNFNELPKHMRYAAKDAFDILLHTGDSQLCDMILDKSLLNKMEEISVNSKVELVKKYAEFFVGVANIKIAVRSCKTNKKIDFLDKTMVECQTLDLDTLKSAATKGLEDIYSYLLSTVYKDAVPYLKDSMVFFEKWYDDTIINLIKKEKSNSFTIAPIIAYVLARQNEIKVLRIIFSGKRNNVSDDMIKERLRCLYV